ncbi:MAG: DUF5011 domain-containing protein [Oscillospiraceae bacterium]|nr:DUF5011 domain-containing protein [Oscillospiraceae bacterium]
MKKLLLKSFVLFLSIAIMFSLALTITTPRLTSAASNTTSNPAPVLVTNSTNYIVHVSDTTSNTAPVLVPNSTSYITHVSDTTSNPAPVLVPNSTSYITHVSDTTSNTAPVLVPNSTSYITHVSDTTSNTAPTLVPNSTSYITHVSDTTSNTAPALVPNTTNYILHVSDTTSKPKKNTNKSNIQQNAVINANSVTIKVGSKFNLLNNVTAKDNGGKGTDLTNKVTVKGTVNTKKAGSYPLTYSVTGSNKVTVTKTITVTVKK